MLRRLPGAWLWLGGVALLASSAPAAAQVLGIPPEPKTGPTTVEVAPTLSPPPQPPADEFRPKRQDYDLLVPFGEKFKVTTPSGKAIKNAYVNREKVVRIIEINKNRDAFLTAQGFKLGDAEITLVDKDDKSSVFKVKILPSVDLLGYIIEEQYPTAHVKLTAGGDNVLFVSGTVDSPAQTDAIIGLLENFIGKQGRVINSLRTTGPTQIQLDCIIARIDRGLLRQMNLNLLYSDKNGFFGNQIGNLIGVPGIAVRPQDTIAGAARVFSPSATATNQVLTSDSQAFFGITGNQFALYGFLNLLKQNQLAKILANPTLITMNGRPADFLVGGEQPVPTVFFAGGTAQPNVQFKTFGTRLVFVPVILGDGKIRLDVLPEVSTVNFNAAITTGGTQVPQFITQRVHTTVEMEPGQTLYLGGLLQTETTGSVDKFPVLGDLPVVGAAFRKVVHQTRETELVIVVTPRLVDPLRDCQRPPLLPGQETRDPTDCELYLHGKLEPGIETRPHGVQPIPPIMGHPIGNLEPSTGGPFAIPAPPVTAPPAPMGPSGAILTPEVSATPVVFPNRP
jgi:pilus assembly protein CpaC